MKRARDDGIARRVPTTDESVTFPRHRNHAVPGTRAAIVEQRRQVIMKRLLARVSWLVLAIASGPASFAQDAVGPPGFELNLSNPGARAMGLGGAFVSLADDATAAFSNPSGLTQLLAPEVSVEARRWTYETAYVERARVEGVPTGFGIDTEPGLRWNDSSDTIDGLAFLSVVHPWRRWSGAIFRHEMANFESTTRTDGLFGGTGDVVIRYLDFVEETDLKIVNYGAAVAYRWSDSLSLGLGINLSDALFSITTTAHMADDTSPETFFAPNHYPPERVFATIHWLMGDTDVTYTTGIIWKSGLWRFGAVYREGATFVLNGEAVAGPASREVPPGEIIDRASTHFGFPNVLALGASVQPGDGRLTVSIQWDRVGYSRILESIDNPDMDVSELRIDDGNEFHAGVEYAFLESQPLVALRGGIWSNPSHKVFATGGTDVQRALLQEGDDELHVTAGAGVRFENVQIDVGADVSSSIRSVAVSAIYVF